MTDENLIQAEEIDETTKKSRLTELLEFVRDVGIILLVVIFIRTYFVSPFQISGHSMEMSYHHQEFILVNKLSYAMLGSWSVWDPSRWDVVVLEPHAGNGKEYYIKRVIGLSGDEVKIQDGEVYLKRKIDLDFIKLNEDYLSSVNRGKTTVGGAPSGNATFLVPEWHYFLMGDNRNGSADSRTCFTSSCNGWSLSPYLKRADVSGKVLLDFGYFSLFQEGRMDFHLGELRWIHAPRWLSTPREWAYPELQK